MIEDTLNSLKKEESHKVLTQGLSTLMKLGKLTPDNVSLHLKLVQFAKQHLNDTSYSVKNKAMDLIGELQPLVGISESSVQATFKLIMDFTHSQDARVRSAAFNTVVRSLIFSFPVLQRSIFCIMLSVKLLSEPAVCLKPREYISKINL